MSQEAMVRTLYRNMDGEKEKWKKRKKEKKKDPNEPHYYNGVVSRP